MKSFVVVLACYVFISAIIATLCYQFVMSLPAVKLMILLGGVGFA